MESTRREEVRAEAVHLVDEADAGHVVLVGLPPHRFGLGLDARNAVEHRNRAVEDTQRTLDLNGEVDVARRVDDVDAVVVPEARRRGGCDGDAALLLLDHPVHLRRAFVDLTDLVRLPRVIEDALGRGGLARVDVGHDPDVPGLLECVLAIGHGCSCVSSSPDLLRTLICWAFVSYGATARRAPAVMLGAQGWHRRGCSPRADVGGLPAVVSERLVRLRHLVHVFLALHRSAHAI